MWPWRKTIEKVNWHDRWDDDAEQRGIAEALKEIEDREGRQRMEEVKKSFERIKSALQCYEVGSKLRLDKPFKDKIKDIQHVNIAMIGPTGSGKTSFINIVEQLMTGTSTAITQGEGREGTVQLEEYLHDFNFRLIDTRGYFHLDRKQYTELKDILTGKIRPFQTIVRETDDEDHVPEQSMQTDEALLGGQIHGVICVMEDSDPRIKQYATRMKSIKEYLRDEGYSPVSALAFEKEEEFKDKAKRRDTVEYMSAAIGSPIDRTFPFINHLASRTDISKDPESALNVLGILDAAVMAAEKFIQVRLQREKTSSDRQAQRLGSEFQAVTDFIQSIGMVHKWDKGRADALVKLLHSEDIYDVTALRDYWGSIKPKLTIGQKSAIERALFA
ncbi:uncharacterized protein LOC144916865 [Branchiostoma floridae x Branchiostoma belcheri]